MTPFREVSYIQLIVAGQAIPPNNSRPLPRMRAYPVWDILCEDTYDSLVDALLAVRSLSMEDLDASPRNLHPPELLKDLERGVERLAVAIRQGEKIVVFGDYDADGVTSTALMLDFLQRAGACCDYLLPDRHADGYGMKPAGVRKAMDKGASLLVTVDNGIAASEAIELAGAQRIDVIVADHHRQLGELPPAHSIINPNRRDCNYPFKGLAGVGVTFKLVQALSRLFIPDRDRRRYLNDLLDLVALGTVADMAPVLGENRVLIRRGSEVLEGTRRPGLRQLKAIARCAGKPVSTEAIGFRLGPRINVAGRLASPDLALKLLRTSEDGEAAKLADELNTLNNKRQKLQSEGLKDARTLVSPDDLEQDRILILLGEDWHLGIVGLLAGKLADKYSRPVAVCTDARGDGTYTGSARSIPAYDISAAINACAEHLIVYGGHRQAAGFSMRAEAFEAFSIALRDHANAHISDSDLHPRLQIDLMLRPDDIGRQTLEALAPLEPFGSGHQAPIFGARNCEVVSCSRIGRQGTHLKLELKVGGKSHNALWWNQGEIAAQVRPGQLVSAAFELQEDSYAGNGAVQMVLRDICPGE